MKMVFVLLIQEAELVMEIRDIAVNQTGHFVILKIWGRMRLVCQMLYVNFQQSVQVESVFVMKKMQSVR